MPNIFRRFLQPNASDFVFLDVEELVEEGPADTTGEQEGEPEEPVPEAEEKGTPSAVDFVQTQTERVLEDARRQAEDYLVRRQTEVEQEAEQVRQQAQPEGYRQGYAEGLRQAGVEGQAELQKQWEQQVEELQAFLEKATAAREELPREMRGELCEFNLAIAEKVTHVSLNSSSEVVIRMIQVAIEKLKRREWVYIYVGGRAAKEASITTPELMTAPVGLSDHIKIIPLSDDETGTCTIEMPDEIIDASASAQLKSIRDLIHEIQGGGSARRGPKAMFQEMTRQIQRAKTISYTGKIENIVGMFTEVPGGRAAVGDICQVYNGGAGGQVMAEVVGSKNDHILLTSYSDMSGISAGNFVHNTGRRLSLRMGPFLKGRVISVLGQPTDGKGPFQGGTLLCVEDNHHINPMTRPPIRKWTELDVKVIDSILTIGKGQRIGIFAGPGIGKNTPMGMIAKNIKVDINVIALVGKHGREVLEFMEKDLGPEGMRWSILMVATSDQSAMPHEQCLSVVIGTAEFSRDQGYDMLLVMSSLTRLAMAQREIGLAVGESPVSRGYTPPTYAELFKLLERSGNSQKGSITGVYTVLVEGDDTNEPIADTVRGILDGHTVPSRRLASSNHFPVINIGASIPRLMADIVSDEHERPMARVRDVMGIHEENADLVSVGAYKVGTNPRLDCALGKMGGTNQPLTQGMDEVFFYEGDLEAIWKLL